jgi:hypothetical protein
MAEQQSLIVREEQSVAPQPVSVLEAITRAASDPNVDVAKMQQLLDMQERLMRISAEREFEAGLAAVQAAAPRVTHDGKIIVKGQLRSTYATLEAVDEALRPLTAEHGFSYRFTTEQTDARTLLVTMKVAHRGGHSESVHMPLPIDASDYRSAVQNVRSSISFAKRCMICDYFNVITAGDDNDGQGGYITDEQVMTIETLIKDTNANVAKFLEWAGAASVAKIPRRKYAEAISLLERKRR